MKPETLGGARARHAEPAVAAQVPTKATPVLDVPEALAQVASTIHRAAASVGAHPAHPAGSLPLTLFADVVLHSPAAQSDRSPPVARPIDRAHAEDGSAAPPPEGGSLVAPLAGVPTGLEPLIPLIAAMLTAIGVYLGCQRGGRVR